MMLQVFTLLLLSPIAVQNFTFPPPSSKSNPINLPTQRGSTVTNKNHESGSNKKGDPSFLNEMLSSLSLPTPLNRAPGPMNWPVVGTLPDFISRGGADKLHDIYEDMYKEYGSICSMSIAGDDETVLSDPHVYEQFIVKNEGRFPFGGAQLSPVFGDFHESKGNDRSAALMTRGSEWKEVRQTLNPDIFAAGNTYLPLIAKSASFASKVLGEQINTNNDGEAKSTFEDFLSRLAFDMFSVVTYGESPNTVDKENVSQEDLEFIDTAQTAFLYVGQMLLDPLATKLKTEKYKQFMKYFGESITFSRQRTNGYVNIARKDLQLEEEQSSSAVSTESGKCPIQQMKSAASSASSGTKSIVQRLVARGQLEDEEISEDVATLLVAGVDTTAYVLSWLYLNLATNPEVQKKLARELDEVLGGEDLTTLEQLESLPYLRACLRESHRLNPVMSTGNAKRIDFDMNIGGFDVKKGEKVTLNIRGIPMDPKFVDEPTEFRPERFLPEAIKKRKGTPREIIDHKLFQDAFGVGKRICLGQRIAVHEVLSSAARLFQDWEILLSDENQKWEMQQQLMMKAYPYPNMKAIPRSKAVEG